MSSHRSVLLLLLLAGCFAGCQNKGKKGDASDAGAGAMAEQEVAAIRERYQRANPDIRVGVVVAVRPELNLAAVGDIPLQDFGINDVLTFIDAREEPFNTGVVVNATGSALHVRYERDRRAPREGDLAVRLR